MSYSKNNFAVLKIEVNTWLKTSPLDPSQLLSFEKFQAISGGRYEIASYTEERNHFKVQLKTPLIGHHIFYYAYKGHSQIVESSKSDGALVPLTLNVPYKKSQIDNFYNPTGVCNVTGYAMVLDYLNLPRKYLKKQFFEDELYTYMKNSGLSPHSPSGLAQMGKEHGANVYFTEHSTIEAVQEWLAAEQIPVVVHGYFTAFGHTLVVVGFDSEGFIVHDPYGEWFQTGYRDDLNLSGAYLRYEYDLIRQKCIPDGNFWVHFISA